MVCPAAIYNFSCLSEIGRFTALQLYAQIVHCASVLITIRSRPILVLVLQTCVRGQELLCRDASPSVTGVICCDSSNFLLMSQNDCAVWLDFHREAVLAHERANSG